MRTALAYLVWPLVVVAGTYGTYVGLETGYPLPVVLFAANAGMLACVLLGEQASPDRPEWSALTDRQSLNDLGHVALVARTFRRR